MKQNHWMLVACGIVLAVGICVLCASYFEAGELSIEELAEQAFRDDDQTVRETATFELAERGGDALPHLRRLITEAGSPEVRAAAAYALAQQFDYDSMDTLLDSMGDESVVVRGRAALAVTKLLGRDRRFRANGSEEDRARIIRHCRADWEDVQKSPHFESFKRKVAGHES